MFLILSNFANFAQTNIIKKHLKHAIENCFYIISVNKVMENILPDKIECT